MIPGFVFHGKFENDESSNKSSFLVRNPHSRIPAFPLEQQIDEEIGNVTHEPLQLLL